MKISMLCFSQTGWVTGMRLADGLRTRDVHREITLQGKSKYLDECIKETHTEWTGNAFQTSEAIIFVCACGIAVRSIAPFAADKKTDPAVLVVDECGKFVISLLSGHLGGANELAAEAAEILGATAVITTATDLHNRFAVDLFAKKNNCDIHPMKAAIRVSAAMLADQKVGFYSDFPWDGELPDGLVLCDRQGNTYEKVDDYKKGNLQMQANDEHLCQVGIAVSIRKDCSPFPVTVHVIPGIVTLGLGCRKGKDADTIRSMAEKCLHGEEGPVFREALEKIASIDLKKDEPGILSLAEKWNLPFQTFSAEELQAAVGTFSQSEFVTSITGTDNICERSAVLASGNGTLIRKKAGEQGVTTALAQREWRINFE